MKDRSVEITQTKTQREKKLGEKTKQNKTEQRIQKLWNIMKYSNIHVIEIAEEERMGTNKKLEEILAKVFPK